MSTHGGGGRGREPHAPGRSPAGWVRRVEQEQASLIAEYAPDHGMSPSEYTRAVDAHIREMTEGAQVFTRRSSESAERILDGGRFLTTIETGRSAGHVNPEARERFERTFFGRPGAIYAWAGHDPAVHTDLRSTSSFGDVVFQLRPGVADRSTITFGDSYGDTMVGTQPRFAAAPLGHADHTAWNFDRGDPLDRLTSLDRFRPYAEVQIHGGLDRRDIAAVYFTVRPPSERMQTLLREQNIPFYLVGMAAHNARR